MGDGQKFIIRRWLNENLMKQKQLCVEIVNLLWIKVWIVNISLELLSFLRLVYDRFPWERVEISFYPLAAYRETLPKTNESKFERHYHIRITINFHGYTYMVWRKSKSLLLFDHLMCSLLCTEHIVRGHPSRSFRFQRRQPLVHVTGTVPSLDHRTHA